MEIATPVCELARNDILLLKLLDKPEFAFIFEKRLRKGKR